MTAQPPPQPPPQRLHKAWAILGRKGTGKSTYANKCALAYIAANPNKRVLIFDVNGSPAYAAHESITYGKFREWSNGIRRLYDSDHERALAFIAKNFDKGLIIFEDCTKYIPANPTKDIKAMLVDHRMMNCDVMFTFHSVKFVPPFFWKMLNAVSLGKTDDNFTHRSLLQKDIPNIAAIAAAGLKLKAHPNQYHRILIETNI